MADPYRTTTAPTSPVEPYWASKPKYELTADLAARVKTYYEGLDDRGISSRIRESYRRYYGMNDTGQIGSVVSRGGTAGEVVRISANHYRNLVTHMLTICTSQRPTLQCRPVNMDPESIAQSISAQGVVDYYWREKRLERRYRKAVEVALVCGRGYIHQTWDAGRGDAYDVDPVSGTPVSEGDVAVDVLTPFDVVKSFDREFDDLDWIIVRLRRNKWDLAARYPEYAAEITSMTPWVDNQAHSLFERHASDRASERDVVYQFVFYHRPTPAMPGGRMLTFVGPEVCLNNGPLPYERLPVYSVAPAEILDTSDGYTSAWDLIGVQQAHDMVLSAVVSNLDAFGHQRIVMEENCQVQKDEVTGGVTIIRIPQGATPPAGINLAAMPDSWAQLEQLLVQTMETISGVNSVARGNPEASLKSGSALALVQTMAVQFLNTLQEAYAHLVEDGATGLVNILKAFASTPRMALIAGDDQRPLLSSWSGKDLGRVSRVVVDVSNALSQTISGRVEQATWLKDLQATAQPGADVQQAFARVVQVATTGKLDPMIGGPQKEAILIRDENRRLRAGPPVVQDVDPITGIPTQDVPDVSVYPTDNPVVHILGHAEELASVEVRQNPAVAGAFAAHINKHVEQMRMLDPALAAVLGFPSLALPPPMPGAPTAGPPGAPPGPENVTGGQPKSPDQPKLPRNPMTGDRVDPGGAPPGPRT